MKQLTILLAATTILFTSCLKKHREHPVTPGCSTFHGPELQGKWYWVQSTAADGSITTPGSQANSQLYIFNPNLVFIKVTGADSVFSTYNFVAADQAALAKGMMGIVTYGDDAKASYYKFTADSLTLSSMSLDGSVSSFARVQPVMWQ